MIHHRLGSGCGHYTSYFLDHDKQQQWFFADDDKVNIYIHECEGKMGVG